MAASSSSWGRCATSPNACGWRPRSASRRRWRPSAAWPAAWRTTSTPCSARSAATARCCSAMLPRDETLRRHVEQIHRAALRGAQLTRQLLAFSRRQEIQAQVVDLEELLADVEVMLDRLIGEDIRLTREIEPRARPRLGRSRRAPPGHPQPGRQRLRRHALRRLPGPSRCATSTRTRRSRSKAAGSLRARTSCSRWRTPARAWTRRSASGSSSRSSPPRSRARVPAWGSPRCTPSSGGARAASRWRASPGRAPPSGSICPAPASRSARRPAPPPPSRRKRRCPRRRGRRSAGRSSSWRTTTCSGACCGRCWRARDTRSWRPRIRRWPSPWRRRTATPSSSCSATW